MWDLYLLKILEIENVCTWNLPSEIVGVSRLHYLCRQLAFNMNVFLLNALNIKSKTLSIYGVFLRFIWQISCYIAVIHLLNDVGLVEDTWNVKTNIKSTSHHIRAKKTSWKRRREYHNNNKNGNHFLNVRLENYLLVSDPTYVLKKKQQHRKNRPPQIAIWASVSAQMTLNKFTTRQDRCLFVCWKRGDFTFIAIALERLWAHKKKTHVCVSADKAQQTTLMKFIWELISAWSRCEFTS